VFPNQAVIAHHLAHNRAIFLLDKTLIILQRWTTPRERQVFLFAMGDQHFIDELPTVVGIDPQDRKGEERPRSLKGSEDRLLAPMQEGQAFRPPSRHIGERQGVQVAALDVGATMGHQVRFQKTGSGLLPLLECTDRNLLLEERSRSRGGKAALTQCALGTQEAISRGCTHGKQLASALLHEVEMLMPLQRFYQGREKGDEAFGADMVGGVPDQEERVLDFRSIPAKM
jgi:hypothetical protein